jgi:hypothetical protein
MRILARRRWRSSKDSNEEKNGQARPARSDSSEKEDEYEYEFVDNAEKMDSGIDWDSGVGWNVVGVPAGKTFHQSACK